MKRFISTIPGLGALIMGVPPSRGPQPTGEETRYTRRNYWVFVFEGGFFLSGVTFVSLDSVLPIMAKSLGSPDWLIAFMPMLMMIGFMLPPLFTAHWLETKGRLLPLLRFTAFIQRLPYIMAAAILFFFGSSMPGLALFAIAACPLVSGLCGGITVPAWMRLTARTVRNSQRSSANALRNMMGAFAGILAGVLIEALLTRLPGSNGFALLHVIAFALLLVSYGFFCMTDEPEVAPPPRDRHRTLIQQLRSLRPIMRADPGFRRYILQRAAGSLIFVTIPFMAVHAQAVTQATTAFAGKLLAWQMVGNMIGNLLGGYLGDRLGSRAVLITMRCVAFAMVLLFGFSDSEILFCLCFSLWGFAYSMQMIGEQTFMAEYTMGPRMPTYISLGSITSLCVMLCVVATSSTLRSLTTDIWPLVVLSATGIATSFLILTTRVPEPRNGETATAHHL